MTLGAMQSSAFSPNMSNLQCVFSSKWKNRTGLSCPLSRKMYFARNAKFIFHKPVICIATSTSTCDRTTKNTTSQSINVIFNFNKEIGPGMTFDIFY